MDVVRKSRKIRHRAIKFAQATERKDENQQQDVVDDKENNDNHAGRDDTIILSEVRQEYDIDAIRSHILKHLAMTLLQENMIVKKVIVTININSQSNFNFTYTTTNYLQPI